MSKESSIAFRVVDGPKGGGSVFLPKSTKELFFKLKDGSGRYAMYRQAKPGELRYVKTVDKV